MPIASYAARGTSTPSPTRPARLSGIHDHSPALPSPGQGPAKDRSSPITPKAAPDITVSIQGVSPQERIVTAAREMFCRDGIHATGVDRILSAAGASKMTLYARFGSKEALVRTALREEGQVWREEFAARVNALADTPEGRLRAIIPALRDWFRSGRFYGCAFINAVAEHTKGEPWLRELAAEHHAACRAFLGGLARDAGFAAPEDMAGQFLILIDGATAGLMCSGDEVVLRHAARTLDALLAVGERAAA